MFVSLQNQMPGEEFPTTNQDLAGFWDMVMLQVVQVNNLFEHIDKLRQSQWQEVYIFLYDPTKYDIPNKFVSHDEVLLPLFSPLCSLSIGEGGVPV